ncbi:hypothetical protein NE237_009049 [Protea cynaroides]|uniref:Uncharacterized protein n=1 Tax=Protea cynaroides TaxID=273540 RepID=A0A9Q0R097_9MAGN|nr:hypothetical protein NE237_009049 [Protea cynaroides]
MFTTTSSKEALPKPTNGSAQVDAILGTHLNSLSSNSTVEINPTEPLIPLTVSTSFPPSLSSLPSSNIPSISVMETENYVQSPLHSHLRHDSETVLSQPIVHSNLPGIHGPIEPIGLLPTQTVLPQSIVPLDLPENHGPIESVHGPIEPIGLLPTVSPQSIVPLDLPGNHGPIDSIHGPIEHVGLLPTETESAPESDTNGGLSHPMLTRNPFTYPVENIDKSSLAIEHGSDLRVRPLFLSINKPTSHFISFPSLHCNANDNAGVRKTLYL